MQLDEVTAGAIQKIKDTLSKEGIALSTRELAEVVESQFIAGNLAFKKGLEIRLPVLGTFIRKNGRENGLAAQALNELKQYYTKEEFERKVLEAKMARIKVVKKRKKEMVRVTFKKLKATANLVNIKNRYDKIL